MSILYFLKNIWVFRKSSLILLTPFIFLPLPILGQSKVASCGYVICIMAVYWMTEACPLAVTSLLPVFFFPLFGIQSADQVSMNYMRQIMFLMLGTFVLCVAVEEWNLHKRFALRALMLFGSKSCWIMLGIMLITAFLSMWMSNTSTAALMHPITMAVYKEMVATEYENNEEVRMETSNLGNDEDCVCEEEENKVDGLLNERQSEEDTNEDIKLKKSMLLAVTYAANLGGIITTVGTPPNLIAIGILNSMFTEEASSELNFVSWMAFCLPIAVICILISWIWIQIRFNGLKIFWTKNDKATGKKNVQVLIRKKYEALGQMSFAEIAVAIHFLVLMVLWLLRDPIFIPGWKSLFPGNYALDSTAAVLVAVSIFLFPSKASSFSWMWRRNPPHDDEDTEVVVENSSFPIKSTSLLTWTQFQRRFPWGVLLMLGSGFALAGGCVDSGLSNWFGLQLAVLKSAPVWLVLLVVSFTMSIITEFTSNSASISIFLPIMIQLALDIQMNPVFILFAATIPTSFAFCLPIATPPNTLAFTYGTLRIIDMASTGIVLNVLCVLIFNLFLHISGVHIFHLHEMPVWALKNITSIANQTALP